jgi:hypothetical protein
MYDIVERQEIQLLKEAGSYVTNRLKIIGHRLEDTKRMIPQLRTKSAAEIRSSMERWGMDSSNPAHRAAWRNRRQK